MRDLKSLLILAAALASLASLAQAPAQPRASTAPIAADGLRPFLALYRRGPRYDPARALFAQDSIQAHIAHHEALGERLIGAGPLRDAPDGNVGIVMIFARDLQEASTWLVADPAVRAGTFRAVISEWSTSQIRAYRRERRQ